MWNFQEIDDRVRKFIKTSNSKRAEYIKGARTGETQLFEQIRDSNIRLSNSTGKSEQKLLESLAFTRNNVEETIARNTEQVLRNIVREDSKDRSFTIRISELFTELQEQFSSIKKSIEGVVNDIKKIKIFNSAKKEMMSETGPTITLSPRR